MLIKEQDAHQRTRNTSRSEKLIKELQKKQMAQYRGFLHNLTWQGRIAQVSTKGPGFVPVANTKTWNTLLITLLHFRSPSHCSIKTAITVFRTITWNSLIKTLKLNCLIICILHKTHLTYLFQVRQNWLTWNADRPQRALKQGLVFQVNVRNAKMNDVIDYANDATGLKCGFCSRCAQDVKTVAQLMWLGVRYNGG